MTEKPTKRAFGGGNGTGALGWGPSRMGPPNLWNVKKVAELLEDFGYKRLVKMMPKNSGFAFRRFGTTGLRDPFRWDRSGLDRG